MLVLKDIILTVCYAHESLQHPLTEVNFAIRSPGCCDNLSKFFETEDTTFVRGILGAVLQPRVDPLSLLRDEVPVEPPLQARVFLNDRIVMHLVWF